MASVALCGAAVNMGFLFTRKIVGGASTLPGPLGVASETQWMHTPREKNMPLSFTVVPLYVTSTTKIYILMNKRQLCEQFILGVRV